jgi:hypothetical protein
VQGISDTGRPLPVMRDNVTFLMTKSLDPFRILLITVCGWMNQQQLQLIGDLREENRVLREPLGQRRLRFNNDQRRRMGGEGKGIGKQASARGGYDCHPRDCRPGIAG